MVVNFKARRISRGERKLTQTPTLIIIKKNTIINSFYIQNVLVDFKITPLMYKG
jgi:hypothetical protein